MKKHKLITAILGNSYRVAGEYLFKCPKCKHHKKKLSVNYEKNVFKCWVCEYLGTDLKKLVAKYGDYSQRLEWSEISGQVEINDFDNLFETELVEEQPQRISLPKEFITLNSKNPPLSSLAAKNYLFKRGLTEGDILKWKVGYCLGGDYANRVIVPSFDDEGYVNYFIARSFVEDWYKYKNPPCSKDIIFNDLNIDWDRDIVLTEGVFDAMKAENSIPLLGSTLSEKSKLFQKIISSDSDIYLALDYDAEKKSLKLIRTLIEYGVAVYKIDVPSHRDVGDMSKEEFKQRKEKASFVEEGDYLLYYALSL